MIQNKNIVSALANATPQEKALYADAVVFYQSLQDRVGRQRYNLHIETIRDFGFVLSDIKRIDEYVPNTFIGAYDACLELEKFLPDSGIMSGLDFTEAEMELLNGIVKFKEYILSLSNKFYGEPQRKVSSLFSAAGSKVSELFKSAAGGKEQEQK